MKVYGFLTLCTALTAEEFLNEPIQFTSLLKDRSLDLKLSTANFRDSILNLATQSSRVTKKDVINSYFIPSQVSIEPENILIDQVMPIDVTLSIRIGGNEKLENKDFSKESFNEQVFANFFINFLEFVGYFDSETSLIEDKDMIFTPKDHRIKFEKIYIPVVKNKALIISLTENLGEELNFICVLGKMTPENNAPWQIMLATVNLGNSFIYNSLHLLTIDNLMHKQLKMHCILFDSLNNFEIAKTAKKFQRSNFYEVDSIVAEDAISSLRSTIKFDPAVIKPFLSLKRHWPRIGFFGAPLKRREKMFYPLIFLLIPIFAALYFTINQMVQKKEPVEIK